MRAFANDFRKGEKVLNKHSTLFIIALAVIWFLAGILIGAKYFCVCDCLTEIGFNKMKDVYCTESLLRVIP